MGKVKLEPGSVRAASPAERTLKGFPGAGRALAHDLPLVIMPMHPMLDQPITGKAVQEQGTAAAIARPRQGRAAWV